MICFELENYKIGGTQIDLDYSDIQVEIHVHPEGNFTKIKKSMETFHPQYKFIFSDVIVDNDDFSKFDIYPNEIHDYLEWDQLKILDFYVYQHIYEQDLNYIFSSNNINKYTMCENPNFRSAKWETNQNNTRLTALNIKTSQTFKTNQKFNVKLITVVQLQLTNLLNYLILFKIIATYFNFKKAQYFLINKIFEKDHKFLSELKQMKTRINSEVKINKSENVFYLANKYIGKFDIQNEENPEVNKSKFNLNQEWSVNSDKENKTNFSDKNFNEKLTILNNQTEVNKAIVFNNFKEQQSNPIINEGNNDKSDNNSYIENNSKRIILNDISKNKIIQEKVISNFENSLKNKNSLKIDENKLVDLNRLLEISVFIKKMQEIDLLKYLLIEEDSMNLFNFLVGKINLFETNNNSYNVKMINLQDSIKRSFIELKENTKISYMDKKILNLFEKFIENH